MFRNLYDEFKDPIENDIYTNDWDFLALILERVDNNCLVLSQVKPNFFVLEKLTIDQLEGKFTIPNSNTKYWCYYHGNDPNLVQEKVSQYLKQFSTNDIRDIKINCLLK